MKHKKNISKISTRKKYLIFLITLSIFCLSFISFYAAKRIIYQKNKEAFIKRTIAAMTLPEKAAQIFVIGLTVYDNGQFYGVAELNPRVEEQIKRYQVGGVILFTKNLVSIKQTKKLIADLQESVKIPMFICIDEEGAISRLAKKPEFHSTKIPEAEILGKEGDKNLTYKIGVILGRELSSLGINMNFAPVADLKIFSDSAIQTRSFGSNPALVSLMVKVFVKSLQSQGVSSVVKHFPGYGSSRIDAHVQLPFVDVDIKTLEKREFLPFRAGINAGVDGVMIAHLKCDDIEQSGVPATFSKKIVTEILRKKLNFKKLIITDALDMGAIVNGWSVEETVVLAFLAGSDILLMPLDFAKAYTAIIEAVRSGKIPEERLNESIKRILDVKYDRIISKQTLTKNNLDPEFILGCPEHQQIVEKINNNKRNKKFQ